MSLDELQQAWRSQDRGRHIVIDPDILLREIRRNRQTFKLAVVWRDFREVGVAIVMTGVFIYLAVTGNGWPLWLVAGSTLWVAAFMTVDRFRHKREKPGSGEPILLSVQGSLEEVEHQIWLLRNVFWWYLLPPGAAIAVYYGYVGWLLRAASWGFVLRTAAQIVLPTGLVFWFVYWLNQRAVRTVLMPRRTELKELLEALTNRDDPQEKT